jgi:FkbM family methyltransferase
MALHGYYVGEIEYHVSRYVLSRLRPGFAMLDVGAHHGIHALVAAHELRARGLHGHVHAFEPDPRNLALLEANLAANGLADRVTVVASAVSDACGDADLVVADDESSGNTLSGHEVFALAPGQRTHALRVRTVTLDAYAAGLDRVDLLKIDVQGAEPSVLRGAKALVARHRPTIVIEAVPGWPTTAETERLLLGMGYRIHGLDREGRLCERGGADAFVAWDWVATPET